MGRGRKRAVVNVAAGLVLPVMLAVAWWHTSADSTSPYFPPLSRNVQAFRDVWIFDHVRDDLVPSVLSVTIGFFLAGVGGVTFGLILGLSPRLRRAFAPLTEFLRSLPFAALVPVGLVLFGPGVRMEALLIGFAASFPVLLSTIDGVRGVDPTQIDTARVYGVRRWARVRVVVLPSALPQIMAGFRIALAIALAGMVIANMFGSSSGLGNFILLSQQGFNVRNMWAGLFMIGLLGCVMNLGLVAVQARILRWHRGWRGAAGGIG